MLGTAIPTLLHHLRHLATTTSSDEQLLSEFVTHQNESAFAALVARHGPMVLNLCRRLLRDVHAAEDAFQATFLVLAQRPGAIRQRTSVAGYLHAVAYRLAMRSSQRRLPSLSTLPAVYDQAAAPPEGLAWKETLGILDQELNQLPDRFRAPLVHCYLEGRTQDEAARRLGWSLNTLRRRLERGRQLLGARLRGRGVTMPTVLVGELAISAVSVPGHLRAATLAAIRTQAVENLAARVAVWPSARDSTPRWFALAGKKLWRILAAAALGAAICFGNAMIQPTGPDPSAEGPTARTTGPVQTEGVVRFGTDRYRHGAGIACLAVSANGTRAATSSGWFARESARVFDLADGRCLTTLDRNPGKETEAVALSPDGKILATKEDTTVYLRDAATGRERCRIELPGAPNGRTITGWLTFSPDGRHLAVTPTGTVVYVIHVETQDVVGTFAHQEPVFACTFSPDGKLMATGGYDNEQGTYFARLWDVAGGKERRRFSAGDSCLRSLAFAPDGQTLAGGGCDACLHLWDIATGKEQRSFPRIGRIIRSVAFTPDSKKVAAAGDRIHLYEATTGKELLQIDRRAHSLVFRPDGKVLTGAVSGAIYQWEVATGRVLTPTAAQDSAVEQILVGLDGRRAFTRDEDGDIHIWDAKSGQYGRKIAAAAARGVTLSPDGRYLAWAVEDDTVRVADPSNSGWSHSGSRLRLYDLFTEQFLDQFPSVQDEASVLAFRPDGKTILALDRRTATVRFWDVASGKIQRSFPVTERTQALPCVPACAALSPNGGTLAIGYDRADNVSIMFRGVPVVLYDVATGKALNRLGGHMNSVNGLTFSPDGRLLVTWGENPLGSSMMDHVYVWDAGTGRAVSTLPSGLEIGAGSAAFAPDGRTLATASADGRIRLWEVATWTIRVEFRGHRDRVTALAFGPDGQLFSGGLDTLVLRREVRRPRVADRGSLENAWAALAQADGATGFHAQEQFLAEPSRSVEWFTTRVTPARPLDPARMRLLLATLSHDDYSRREQATAELKEFWPLAKAGLREVVDKSPSPEARRRAAAILEEMAERAMSPGELRALRAAEVLEWIGTPEARALLRKLTSGSPDAQLTRDASAACKRLERQQ